MKYLHDLNLNSKIGQNLRDYPISIHDTQLALKRLDKSISIESNPIEKARLLAFSGGLLRRTLQLKQAEKYLLNAISIMRKHEVSTSLMAYEIRLAHVYHWQEDFNTADQLFEELLTRAKQDESIGSQYLDFIWQHYAKCKFDQGDYLSAFDMFTKALKLRQKKKSIDLIQSTEYAIDMTLKNLNRAKKV